MTQAERNLLMLVAQALITERAICHPQPGSLWDQIRVARDAVNAELNRGELARNMPWLLSRRN